MVNTTLRFLLPSLFLGVILPLSSATAADASLTLAWNANSEPDIAGYRLHYGTAANPYGLMLDVATTSAPVSGLQNGDTYTFAVTAYNTDGVESSYSLPVSYTPGSPRLIPPATLANISARTRAGSGENVLIGGFIIDGIVAKRVALRAIGPSLSAFGVDGAMSDPALEVVDSTGAVVVSNDNWNVPGEEVSALGLAPSDGREAALVAMLEPGSYTAIISGKPGDAGVALFDLYDLALGTGRVANISTRSRVETDDSVMIAGFILSSTDRTKVIVRAIGPSLVQRGVKEALLNPMLGLYDSNGSLVSSNDNWRDNEEGAIMESNLAPTDDREAAIVATLAAGAYSGVVRGANGMTGVALIEVFALNE